MNKQRHSEKVQKKLQQRKELFLPIFLTENMKLRPRTFQAWSNRNVKKRLENGRCLFLM